MAVLMSELAEVLITSMREVLYERLSSLPTRPFGAASRRDDNTLVEVIIHEYESIPIYGSTCSDNVLQSHVVYLTALANCGPI